MSPGRVYLVGVGPGSSQLLTRQAAAVIGEAQEVRHVGAMDLDLLFLLAPGVEARPFADAEEVLDLARQGRRIAVLYRGDPYTFNSGARLADDLAREGQDFDVVPGVLSEVAAAAAGGMPLTLEGRAQSVSLGLGRADSVAVRLAEGWWEAGVEALVQSGTPRSAPAAIVANPGGSGQRAVWAPLTEVVEQAQRRGMSGEVVLLVGPGVEMAPRLDTGARRPLHGRRVLVTRARHEAEPLRKELERQGATVLEAPTIEIRALPAGARFKSAVDRLPSTGLIVFTTANAVRVFFGQLFSIGVDARHLHSTRVCALGSETAKALETRGIKPDLVADDYSTEGLSTVLQGVEFASSRVLIPRLEGARDALMGLLVRRGFKVDQLPIYRAVRPAGCRDQILSHLREGSVDAVTFTSSATAINFVSAFPNGELPPKLESSRFICMGPATADTLSRLGMRVGGVASEFTVRGLAAAVVEALA